MNRSLISRAIAGASACFLATAGSAMANGGSVEPASAQPLGYSLSTLAQDTAVYNTGFATSNPATPAPPSIPFLVVEQDATVSTSTYLYLPIFYADNSAPADPNFPSSIANQSTDAAYLDNYVLTNYNVTAFLVQVDGQTTTLNDSYIVGVNTPTLLDGTPGGNEYITDAVVLSPLSYGSHTVAYGGIIDGSPVIFGTSTITAVPEPASTGLLSAGALALLRRRKRA